MEILEDRTVPSNIVVNSLSDATTHTGISLRDAIVQSNNDAAAGTSDTITFDPSLTGKTITLAQGSLELKGHGAETITIDGGGQVTVSGNHASGIFLIDAGVTATLAGLDLVQGNAPAGGAIDNKGALTVSNCTLSGNAGTSSSQGGGAIFNDSGATLTVAGSTFSGNSANAAAGGAILNNKGTGTIDDCTFSGNLAHSGGALADSAGSTTDVRGSVFTGNAGQEGGGLFLAGMDTVADTTLSGNSAGDRGGAINNTGTLSLTDATLSANTAVEGGGILNTGTLTLTGGTLSSNSAQEGGAINNGPFGAAGTLTATGVTISGNSAAIDGGGISTGSSMTLVDALVTGNSSPQDAGGISNGGTLTVINSTVSGNTGGTSGGIANGAQPGFSGFPALTVSESTISGNAGATTGGIGNDNSGNVTVSDSTLSGNSGGTAGGIDNAGQMTVTNSTLADNSATSATAPGATGGGVANQGSLTVSDATIADNSAAGSIASHAGGIGNDTQGFLVLLNSIVAANQGASPDVAGKVSFPSHGNVIGNGTGMSGIADGSFANHVGTQANPIDPQLGPLAGGPTATLAPAPTSPAVTNQGVFLASLTSSIGPSDTTLAVDDVAAIASTPGNYLIQIDSEQMLVTAVNLQGQTLTVERGYNGTMAAAHSFGFVFHPADQVGQPRGGSSSDIGAYEYQANTTVNSHSLTLGQTATGQLGDISTIDDWTFTASANQQVQFQQLAASGVLFDLTGPGGYTAFVNATGSSGLTDLPVTGSYTLAVHAAGAAGTYAYSFDLVPTPVAALTVPGTFNGTLAASGQAQLLSATVSSPTVLSLALSDTNAADVNNIYVSQSAPPTPAQFQYHSSGTGADASVSLAAQPGTYYVLVYNRQVAAAGSYTLQATSSAFLVTSLTPGEVATNQAAEVFVRGFLPLAQQLSNYQLQFIAADGTTILPATPLTLAVTDAGSTNGAADGSVTLTATLPANTLPTGVYSARITDSQGNTQTLASAITVSAGSGVLQTQLLLPSALTEDSPDTIYLQYLNSGTAPLAAPLLGVTATQKGQSGAFLTLNASLAGNGFDSTTTPPGYGQNVQFLGSGAISGLLEPGESVIVPVYYAGWQSSKWAAKSLITFSASPIDSSNPATIDWNALKSSLEPSYINSAAWNALFPTLIAQLGATWGQYVAQLDSDATYLAGVGEPTNDIEQLLYFEIEKANASYTDQTPVVITADSLPAPGLDLTFVQTFNESISGRYTTGILGYGWTTNWDISAATDVLGDAIIRDNGTTLVFTPNGDGSYQPEAGDHGTIVFADGAYQFTGTDGSVYQFNSDGTLAYLQDANDNRISTHYDTAGRLVALVAANGEALALSYNAQGHLAELIDSTGQTESYGYDPTGQFLTSFTTSRGTTTFSYVTGQSPAQNNALASVLNPGQTEVFFSYDSQGRLIDQHANGSAPDQTTTYLNPGGYVIADALHHQTTLYFNLTGAPAETIDSLGNITRSFYDRNQNPVQIHGPLGQSVSYTYDANGNLTSATDPLGNTVSYTYDAKNNLISFTDAKQNTTRYAYDGQNNLLSITYADNNKEQFSYNPLGEATQFITANGATIGQTYNAQGLLTGETFADGTSYSFTYDERGNLTSATSAGGTITFKYQDPANPNRFTEVDYPDGKYLRFTYNKNGQRTQSVDQTGFTVQYIYDPLGRLQQLIDGSNNLIVQYTYDAAGNLSQKDMGNGTRTVYSYDGDGSVLSIANYAADHTTVNSFDDYTYDARGNVLTDTNRDGVWTYTYDADSQLTQATFAPNASDPDGLAAQNLQYAYDATGNRVSETVNGVTTSYSVNAVNEYTSSITAGVTTQYTYDKGGNRISQSDGTNSTSYTFNDLSELTAVTGPGVSASYSYDPRGSLIAQTLSGVTTRYQVDPAGIGNVVAAYDGSGTLTGHYTYGLGLTSLTDSGGTSSYYDFNNIGSTVGISGANGSYVNRYSYLPFGATAMASGTLPNPFTFSGASGGLDDGSGTLRLDVRHYDQQTGQFLSPDPLNLGGGDTNVRRYVGNNPVNAIDPLGLGSLFIGGQGGFGISGTYGYTINSNGDIFSTTGGGVTSGGLTSVSLSPVDATEGTSAETTATSGHDVIGVTGHFPAGEGSPYATLDIGVGVPGVGLGQTTNKRVGNLFDILNHLPLIGPRVPYPPGYKPPQNPPPGGSGSKPMPGPTSPAPGKNNSSGGSSGSTPGTTSSVFTAFVHWKTPADITYGTPLSGTQLNATANMPGTFTYSPAAGTVLKAGKHQKLSVTFFAQDGEQVKASVYINVLPAPVMIEWNPPANINYGTPLSGAQLNATASAVINGARVNVPGTFTYSPSNGAVLPAGFQVLKAHFMPSDAIDYASADSVNYITVLPDRVALVWQNPADIDYGTPLSNTQLSAQAISSVNGVIVTVPGTFYYSPPSGTVLDAGNNQLLSASFSPSDPNFLPAFGTAYINVHQARTMITWAQPDKITYGTPLTGDQLNAQATARVNGATVTVPGTLDYTPPAGTTLLPAGEQPLAVHFTPNDANNYTQADGNTTIEVDQAMPGVKVTAKGGPYNGKPYKASAQVAGVDGIFGPTLETVTPTIQYFVGGAPLGQPLAQPPVLPGTYTAVAVFPGSSDYTNASISTMFTITPTRPAFTSPAHTTFTAAQSNSFTIVSASSPTASLTEKGTLPAGVTFTANSDGTATLSGTPDAAIGTFVLNITADNGGGTATQVFALTIADPPTFTSNNQATFITGKSGSFTVSATSSVPAPISFSTSDNVPGGITLKNIKSGTAILGGTAAPGTYTFSIIASNGPGSITVQPFTLQIDQAPSITDPPIVFTVGQPGTFTVRTKGFPTPALTESGTLPANVTFTDNGDGTGTLTGTPAAGTASSYPFTITAKNSAGTFTQAFTLVVKPAASNVNQAPTITSVAAATFAAGEAGRFSVTTRGYPAVALSESGTLPAGVTFTDNGDGTATLSGTPQLGTARTAPYSFTITAHNGVMPDFVQTFQLTVDQPAVITSASSTTFTTGTAGSFTVATAPALPAKVTLSESGALPAGVRFVDNKNGTATLSGTPRPGSGGTYFITITSRNAPSSAWTQKFKLVVQQPPAVTSAASTMFASGQAGSFTIMTSGCPTATLTESGALPAGLTFTDNGNGTASISGSPQAGTAQLTPYSLTITAHNGSAPDFVQTFHLSVVQLPVITSAASDTFTVGQNHTFTVQTTAGIPGTTTLSVTGALPAGITFTDNHDGTAILGGTPKAGTGKTYSFTIAASNGTSLKSTQTFALTVDEAPSITSAAHASFTIGRSGTFTITTSGFPAASLTLTGSLPNGVTFTNNGNGTATLTGIPQAGTAGSYPVTISAGNGSGSVTQSFTLSVAPASHPAPAITSAKSVTFMAGQAGTFTVTTTGFPAPALTEAGTLPAGVTFTDNGDGTATLSGTPQAGSGGSYTFTITASNGVLPAATQTFMLNVDEPIAFTSPDNAVFTANQNNTLTITTTGFPAASIIETGPLPSGVTLTDKGNGTAILSGKPSATGDFRFTILASVGGVVKALQSFDLTVMG
jgi:RHS repeat-associated protein